MLTGAIGGIVGGIAIAAMTAWLMGTTDTSLLVPLRAAATLVTSGGISASPIIGLGVHVVLAAT